MLILEIKTGEVICIGEGPDATVIGAADVPLDRGVAVPVVQRRRVLGFYYLARRSGRSVTVALDFPRNVQIVRSDAKEGKKSHA